MHEEQMVEITWLDITERDIEPHLTPDSVECVICQSWGVLVDDGPFVRIVREVQGETRTVQVFPRSCVKRIRRLGYVEEESEV